MRNGEDAPADLFFSRVQVLLGRLLTRNINQRSQMGQKPLRDKFRTV